MIYFFIDEAGFNQSGMSMLGCVITDTPDLLRSKINELKDDILHNPRYSRMQKKFEMSQFHHAENSREIQNEFVGLLSRLTFQAYICYIDDPEEQAHRNEIYERLFRRIIRDRLEDYRMQTATIYFEHHDTRKNKRLEDLQQIATRVDFDIKTLHQISGIDPPIIIGAGKEEPCLAIADYVCAIFHDYYKMLKAGDEREGGSLERRDFDELRGKVRLIHDYGNGVFYSRRNPFP